MTMNYFPTIDNATGTVTFPLSMCGSVNPQFAKTLAQANSPLLLKYVIDNDGMAPTGISVNPGSLLSLNTRFQTPVAARALVNLFGQLYSLITALQSLGLPLMNVVFDTNYMYTTSPEMGEVQCIYLPVVGGPKNITAAKEFFEELPNCIKPAGKEAEDMLKAFKTFSRNQEHFNVAALTTFLGNLASAQVSDGGDTAETAYAFDASGAAGQAEPNAANSFMPATDFNNTFDSSVAVAPDFDTPNMASPNTGEPAGTMVLNAVEFAEATQRGAAAAVDALDQTVQVPPVEAAPANMLPPPLLRLIG